MRLEFHFLDYIWKALLAGSVTATIFLVLMLGLALAFTKSSARDTKWCFNMHYLLLLVALVGGMVFIAIGDPELVAGCFDHFVAKTTSSTVTRGLAGLWLLGLALLLALDAVRYVLAARKMESVDLRLPIFAELKLAMGLGTRTINLRSTPTTGSPFVYGWIRHQVVLPDLFLRTANDSTRRSILAHELIHARDFDSLWMSLELLCRRILFFHPLAYFARAVYLDCIERAADDLAIKKAGILPYDYVQSLILAVSLTAEAAHCPLRMNVSRGFAETKRRILAVQQRSRPRRWSALILLITPVLSLGLSVARAQVAKVRAAEINACSQVAEEQIIKSWLRIETVINKCE